LPRRPPPILLPLVKFFGVLRCRVLSWLFGSRSVQTRLGELEETVKGLKSSFKNIEADWEATYRKLHAARVSINDKLRRAEKIDEDGPGATNGHPPAPQPEPDAILLRRVFPRR